jgi:hypothetical protein
MYSIAVRFLLSEEFQRSARQPGNDAILRHHHVQRHIPCVDRKTVHLLKLVGQADAQGRLRPVSRRPVVVPTPASEAVASRVPRHHGQEHDAVWTDLQRLGATWGGDAPTTRDQIALAAVGRKGHRTPRHAGQADRQAEPYRLFDHCAGRYFVVARYVSEDAVAPAQQAEISHAHADQPGDVRSLTMGERSPLAALASADCLLVNHPYRDATGTDTCECRLNSVVANDIAAFRGLPSTATPTLSSAASSTHEKTLLPLR